MPSPKSHEALDPPVSANHGSLTAWAFGVAYASVEDTKTCFDEPGVPADGSAVMHHLRSA